MYSEDHIQEAQERVKHKKSFYSNLFSWLAVSLFLMMICAITCSDEPWFLFPFFGWGLGVAFHWYAVFGAAGKYNKKWERKQMEKELERIRKSESFYPVEETQYEARERDELELEDFRTLKKKWDENDFV